MFFSKLAQREKYVLYISIIIISFLFIDKVMISPVTRILNKLNKEISTYEKKLEHSMQTWNKRDSIGDKYKVIMQGLKKVASDEEEMASMSSEIEKLGRKTSVLIKNIKPLPVKEEGLYVEYNVTIEAESEMSFLMDFIYQLEKSPQLVKVTRFSLIPKNKKSNTLKISLLITKILII